MKFGSVYLASTVIMATSFVAPVTAQQTDWTQRVTLSAKGGHIMGNPLAKHQLTEYMSYTCNHCANFENESYAPLRDNYIKKGLVNFEVRNLVLNAIDLTAAMVARCGGRTKFFGNHRALLMQQSDWMKKFELSSPATKKTLNEGTIQQRMQKIAKATGLYDLMLKRGHSSIKMDACLNDEAELKKILNMTEHATKTLKLTGTPSFIINGKTTKGVHSWGSLKPKLANLPK
jgi:protein-disulfide isomerase